MSMLYGSGMRLMECLQLRVKDLDLAAARAADPRCQGSEGPRHDASRLTGGAPAGSPGARASCCSKRTATRISPGVACHSRCAASIRRPRPPGPGTGCFPRQSFLSRSLFGRAGALSPLSPEYPARGQARDSRRRHRRSPRARTPSATASRRTCSKTATTSAPCRSCSATRT